VSQKADQTDGKGKSIIKQKAEKSNSKEQGQKVEV
jgi:hypothetical protein